MLSLVRDLDEALTSNDESAPTSPETAPTLVAVPLDDGECVGGNVGGDARGAFGNRRARRRRFLRTRCLARGGRSTHKSSVSVVPKSSSR